MRRALGLLLCLGGLGLLGFVGADYGRGLLDRDAARARWAELEARAAVQAANAHLADSPGPVAPGTPVARLVVPSIALDEVIIEGVGADVLNAGPGHMPGTPLPGGAGNSVVSAHRDMHFRRLAELRMGDTLVTITEYHRTTWRITGRRIVSAAAASLFPTPEATLTLTTCWPMRMIGPAPDRLLLTAEPLVAPAPDSPPAAIAGRQEQRS